MNQNKNESRGDRSLPSVNDVKPKNRDKFILILFLVIVCAVGSGAVYWTLNRMKTVAKGSTTSKPAQEQSTVKSRKFENDNISNAASISASSILPPPAPAEIKIPPIDENINIGKFVPIEALQNGAKNSPPSNKELGTTRGWGSSNNHPIMTTIPSTKGPNPYDSAFVINGGVQPGGAVEGGMGTIGFGDDAKTNKILAKITGGSNIAPQSTGGSDGGKGALQGSLTPTNTPTVKAGFLGNRSLIASEGTTIKCVLRTRIVAMKPGFVICRMVEPLMSANGKVILVDRGAKVTGEQSGSVRNGETRLYVLWRRIETADGVIINIDAPAADALGGSGVDGEIDNHWSQRIGASLMLTLVNDAFAYEIARMANSNNTNANSNTSTVAFQSTTQSGNKIAEKVLDSTINIPPTLYRNQGDQIVIMIPRDLDFSTVYDIQPK